MHGQPAIHGLMVYLQLMEHQPRITACIVCILYINDEFLNEIKPKKVDEMTERERKIGITLTQLISLIGVVFMVIAAWVSMNNQMAETRTDVNNLKRSLIELRQENREDNKALNNKIDDLIISLKKL